MTRVASLPAGAQVDLDDAVAEILRGVDLRPHGGQPPRPLAGQRNPPPEAFTRDWCRWARRPSSAAWSAGRTRRAAPRGRSRIARGCRTGWTQTVRPSPVQVAPQGLPDPMSNSSMPMVLWTFRAGMSRMLTTLVLIQPMSTRKGVMSKLPSRVGHQGALPAGQDAQVGQFVRAVRQLDARGGQRLRVDHRDDRRDVGLGVEVGPHVGQTVGHQQRAAVGRQGRGDRLADGRHPGPSACPRADRSPRRRPRNGCRRRAAFRRG